MQSWWWVQRWWGDIGGGCSDCLSWCIVDAAMAAEWGGVVVPCTGTKRFVRMQRKRYGNVLLTATVLVANFVVMKNLTTCIPSSCIVLMVHVVKGCQHTAPQSQRRSVRPTLDLNRDKFRCFNHRR